MATTAPPSPVDNLGALSEQDRGRKAAQLQFLAQQFRMTVFDVLHEKGTGHWGGAASAAELLVSLYFDALNVRPEEPRWPGRDRLVVSKGHASCMLYTVLAHRGYFPVDELKTFRKLNSRLQGHERGRSLMALKQRITPVFSGLLASPPAACSAGRTPLVYV